MTTDSSPVLVIDGDRKHRSWITRIVQTVAPGTAQLLTLNDDRDLRDLELIVAHFDSLDDDERGRLLAAIERAGDAAPTLLVVSSATQNYQLFLDLEPHGISNILATDSDHAAAELIITMQKILRRDIFGVDKYFGWGVQPFGATLRASRDVEPAVDRATDFADRLGVHPRLVENLATVTHELLTNALYNAPIDGNGAPRFAHLPRTTPVELDDGESVSLSFCSDGRTIGVAVRDSFGSLTREQCLDYLMNGVRSDDRAPSQDKGGAGLGLYLSLEALNHLVINIGPGSQTEAIGLIDIRGSYRDFARRGKSFNIFLSPPSADDT
jgi:hypothetical protein